MSDNRRSFTLSREATGEELEAALRKAADETCFDYDADLPGWTGICLSRRFPEHADPAYLLATDTTPSFELRFPPLQPARRYATLDCETYLGTMHLQPFNMQELDEGELYEPHYQRIMSAVDASLR